ncbi:hypothetical protein N7530_010265 [Penicillium desertorum]|uniref:Uncharacterized protein n=1 Tax=Penicillium desertorum TaxID=1303715 RepID=A0A9W9WK21_9EURO|nr:hypothetical protein N7530_010265 [Penicillium desertorum]
MYATTSRRQAVATPETVDFQGRTTRPSTGECCYRRKHVAVADRCLRLESGTPPPLTPRLPIAWKFISPRSKRPQSLKKKPFSHMPGIESSLWARCFVVR